MIAPINSEQHIPTIAERIKTGTFPKGIEAIKIKKHELINA
jgi:hypothetical protein